MKAPGTPVPMQLATSTCSPRKLPDMTVPVASTSGAGPHCSTGMRGDVSVFKEKIASFSCVKALSVSVPLNALAPFQSETEKNNATASEPDPAEPEPYTASCT